MCCTEYKMRGVGNQLCFLPCRRTPKQKNNGILKKALYPDQTTENSTEQH